MTSLTSPTPTPVYSRRANPAELRMLSRAQRVRDRRRRLDEFTYRFQALMTVMSVTGAVTMAIVAGRVLTLAIAGL